ncbi:MAG: anthranilate synthase component I [Cytophagales bacterium]|nr:anthranilate synthase component I [Armatimonadota bacterium]
MQYPQDPQPIPPHAKQGNDASSPTPLFTYSPSREEFQRLARQGNLVPVFRDVLADMETPVSAFTRIAHRPNAFLLESVEGGERMARYSFLGADPYLVFRSKGNVASITENGETRTVPLKAGRDPLHVLEEILSDVRYVEVPGLPRFVGGAVGYIGYDWVRFLEPIGEQTTDDLDLDDVHLLLTDTLCIFDHVQHRIRVLANARVAPNTDLDTAYDEAVAKVEMLIEVLRAPRPADQAAKPHLAPQESAGRFVSNLTQTEYKKMVLAGQEYIVAGDIIQTVLSQRFSRPLHADPFTVYRALRSLNPSPYMFYLAYENGVTLVGASPEILVTEERGRVTVRPIAGTRRRGETPEKDAALARELIADEKERAEHIMLVDLGRNDIGRICEYGSIHVDALMVIEKYSHVMHIVSSVSGQLSAGKTAFDVLRATFPAGTLSGAPKVRAMQIIEELEPTRRGVYGGAIGYFSYNGNLDACITIRTLLVKEGVAYVQAGGGIVADSDPEAEYEETVNKSNAVRRAVELAERGLQ